jgi:hypothetical protein
MPDLITRTEYVEINSVPLATPAWIVLDTSPLWDTPPVRGTDRIVPYTVGQTPLKRIYDAHRFTLPMVIHGAQDRTGTFYSDVRVGLYTNVQELITAVVDPEATAEPGLKVITLHAPGGVTRTGDCLVIPPLHIGANLGRTAVRAALDIIIPAGVLT